MTTERCRPPVQPIADGQVRLALRDVLGQQIVEQRDEVGVELLELAAAIHVGDDPRVEPGERSQARPRSAGSGGSGRRKRGRRRAAARACGRSLMKVTASLLPGVLVGSSSLAIRLRSCEALRPVVSITSSARSLSGLSRRCSRGDPRRSTLPAGEIGWRRRVSLKRVSSVWSSASEEQHAVGHPLSIEGRRAPRPAPRSSRHRGRPRPPPSAQPENRDA